MQKTWVWSLGQKDTLEKEMETHSSILAWGIPWTEEPGGYSPWGQKRVWHKKAIKQCHRWYNLRLPWVCFGIQQSRFSACLCARCPPLPLPTACTAVLPPIVWVSVGRREIVVFFTLIGKLYVLVAQSCPTLCDTVCIWKVYCKKKKKKSNTEIINCQLGLASGLAC